MDLRQIKSRSRDRLQQGHPLSHAQIIWFNELTDKETASIDAWSRKEEIELMFITYWVNFWAVIKSYLIRWVLGWKEVRQAACLGIQISWRKMKKRDDSISFQRKGGQCHDLSDLLRGWQVRSLQIGSWFCFKEDGILGQLLSWNIER